MRTILTALVFLPLLACAGTTVEPATEDYTYVVTVPDNLPEGAWVVPVDGSESFPHLAGGRLCVGTATGIRIDASTIEVIKRHVDYWVFWYDYSDENQGDRHEITPALAIATEPDCEDPERPENNNG